MSKQLGRSVFDALRRVVIAAIAVFGFAGHAAAQTPINIVANGGFEAPVISGGSRELDPGTGLTSWVISGEEIKLNRGSSGGFEGSQWIDLTGRGGTVSQPLVTLPGRSYKLNFRYSTQIGSTPGMTVRWGPSGSPSYTEAFTVTADKGWVSAERTVTATSASTVLSFKSTSGNNNYGVQLDAVSVTLVPVPYATPTLIRAVSTGGTGVYLIGRVDGASNLPLTLQAFSGLACTGGALVGGAAAGSALPVTTDPNGYFGVQLASGVTPGYFVAIKVTAPTPTQTSSCVVSSADNDTWPKALQLTGNPATAGNYIDVPGRARWYKFDVLPGQRIQISLSGLPADYDLAVFKDIGTTFQQLLGLASTADLTRLSAEYAPSAFSPSAFSPSAFSPSAFSPSAFSPSAFSPSAFSASVFSPSAFSPSAFSPSAFSPSAFSPSAFSPSAFSPSAFSPSAFSPSAFSAAGFTADELASAFSSAQTRSIIGVSATPGTGDELVVVNSWNNRGSFYVRVSGRGGAYSTAGQFQVKVAGGATTCASVAELPPAPRAAAGAGISTVILTDSSKVALDETLPGGGTLRSKLTAFASRPEVVGAIVDVAFDSRVGTLKTQAANNAACPYATNLVAQEIKSIVDSFRPNNPGLRFVVIAGNDDAVPFFRYPDQSLLGQESGYFPPVLSTTASDASLRNDFVLSQDAYGAGTRFSLRASEYPVPGLAVGRLVESPADMAGLVDAYVAAGGVVRPSSSLVSGYDFLADAANAVKSELDAGTGVAGDALITPNTKSPQDPASWGAKKLDPTDPLYRADSLEEKLLGDKLLGRARHDLIFLAGHFSANSALAADFTTSLVTTDLAASPTDFTNSIVFSAGCHSGYNLVDGAAIPGATLPLDWAQAFAQKKATLVAGTGYQYGDTDFIEYSERLYLNFAKQLRAGSGAIAVGEALVKAKLAYLAATPDIRGIHEKALLEATLFGLPMLGVDMPAAGRVPISGTGGVINPIAVNTIPGTALGLKTADLTIAPVLTANSVVLKHVDGTSLDVNASYLSGPDGVVSNPVEPALPLVVRNVTPTVSTLVLRGVGFRGGAYTDSSVTPLTGAATTELRGVHVPFVSPVFFPMRLWTPNYFGALSGSGGTSLLVTPVQHRATDIENALSTRRQYSSLNLRLYYSSKLDQSAMSDAPTIVSVIALPYGGGVEFTAQIVGDPAAGLQEAWVTYTDGLGQWTPLDLAQCVAPLPTACGTTADSSIWKARLSTLPANFKYVVQAANGYGLVTFDDNRGLYYVLGGLNQVPTTVALGTPVPTSSLFGDNVTVSATLASGGPVVGRNVLVTIGGAARAGLTDANGRVTVTVPAVTVPGSYSVVASFAGDDGLLPSSAAAPFDVGKATTSLSALTAGTTGVTLSAAQGTNPQAQPLMQETVQFKLRCLPTGTTTCAGVADKTVYVITDYLGQAKLPPTGLPAGSYELTASFGGNATYAAFPIPPQTFPVASNFAIATQTISFGGGVGLPSAIPYPGTATFAVSSQSGQPVTVGLSPNPNPSCTISPSGTNPSGTNYTLTATAPGTCTISASAGGTTTLTDVAVTTDVNITKGAQTIAFGTLPDRTFGDLPFTVAATGGATNNAVTFGSTTPAVCTASGNTVTIFGAGTCAVTADQAGNAFYSDAATVVQSFTVNKAAQTITFGGLGAKTYGDAPFGVGATASSGLAVTFSSTTASVCTVSGSSVTIVAAGTCTIAADQPGNGNYNPAAPVTQSFLVNKAGQSITFGALAAKVYGDVPFTVAATATSGLAVGFSSTTASVCTVSGSSVTIVAAGTCMITADQPGNGNYNAAAQVTQSFAVNKAAQTITFGGLGPKTYGDAPFAVSATASSGLAVGFSSTTASVCTVSGSSVSIVATGTCTIAADQPGNGNYIAAAQVTQSFAVNKAAQTISFPAITPTPTFVTGGTGTFAVNPTATSGLPVTVSSLTQGVCTVAGTTVTMKSAGLCSLAADQAGNGNYSPAPQAAQSVTIGKAAQTITFANPGPRTLATPTVALVASASSGLPVSFTANGSCTVAGATLTLTATGSCTVTASQSGNANFSAATAVPQTFAIDLANVWTLLPNRMAKPRLGHTATRFESGPLAGWVLIAGGVDRTGTSLQTSELYNPATRTFVAAANGMMAKAADHAAALLQTGTVIVLGGGSSSAQMFDPATRTWSSAGTPSSTLTPNRFNHTATRLPDGRVLFVGGADSSGNTLKTTILYTPPVSPATTGTFAAGPLLDVARESHTATLLPDGKVLVVGGRNKSSGSYTSRATYQICTATACTASTGNIGNRHAHAAVALGPDGSRVLVAGGANGTTEIATVALFTYDAITGTGTWATTGLGSLATARSELTLSELPNGRAIAAGGGNGNSLKAVDVYQPPFGPVAPMNIVRAGHTATVLKDSAGNFMGILVVGGADSDSDADDALDSAELYGTL